MTAPRREGASPALWVGLVLMGAAIVAIAFAGQDTAEVGGFADPNGTGSEGLLGLNLFIQEAGGQTILDVGNPTPDIDVAILATPAYNDAFAEIRGDADRTEQNFAPILQWVEDGGILLTSVDVPGGPPSGTSVEDDDDVFVPRGLCTLDALAALDEVRPLAHVAVRAEVGDESCFGEAGEAVVVARRLGSGQIVRLASMGLFFNRALDDADNGALAARLVRIDQAPLVGFLSGPPAGPLGGGVDGPVNDDGEPVGAGEDTLFDLVPRRVIAMLVGLGGAFLLYAISRGRRLGSPVVEPIPIELPSSTYVDAVGRLFGRAENASQRSASILRTDLRTDLARRVGMPPDATSTEIAGAIVSSEEREAVIDLLDGSPPANDAALVALATGLNTTRERIDRGGVASLLRSEGIALDEPLVTERNPDD